MTSLTGKVVVVTMPGGHEDPLIHLSEQMVRCAGEQAAEQQREGDRTNQTRAFT
jgi:hypothetical protein